MQEIKNLTGMTSDELKQALHEIEFMCVMNAVDLEMAQRHAKVLNAIYDSLT